MGMTRWSTKVAQVRTAYRRNGKRHEDARGVKGWEALRPNDFVEVFPELLQL